MNFSFKQTTEGTVVKVVVGTNSVSIESPTTIVKDLFSALANAARETEGIEVEIKENVLIFSVTSKEFTPVIIATSLNQQLPLQLPVGYSHSIQFHTSV